jgi:hypothetical protein
MKTCTIDNCHMPHVARGMCGTHYKRWSTGVELGKPIRAWKHPETLSCSIAGCNRKHKTGGMCAAHYHRKIMDRKVEGGFQERTKRRSETCTVSDCGGRSRVKNLCESHYRKLKKYSLSMDALLKLESEKVCRNKGCRTSVRLHIDHDHACCSGQKSCGSCVRGWLCQSCNMALGLLGEDRERIIGLAKLLAGQSTSPQT